MLNFKQVTHAYDQKTVIDEMSFELESGQIACLLGASGCGKTTVLRLISGFEEPKNGEIILDGKVLWSANNRVPPHLRDVGMVFQDYALFPHLNVLQNISFGLSHLSATERNARAHQMLELINLSDCVNQYPHQLSGGQQQRISLARALARKPKLLLLDEPFSNLDVELRERLSSEIRDILKHEGVSAILVTHDQNEAFSMADVVGVMDQGKLMQWANPYDLYHQPTSRYVAEFIGQGVLVKGKVSGPQCVSLEIGEYCGVVPLGFQIGDSVDVLLRPDDIIHDDHSTLTAKVVQKLFRGTVFYYTLELPSGAKLMTEVPSHHNHMIGEQIGIHLELDHLIAFK